MTSRISNTLALGLLALMAVLAGRAALHESVTFDEVAHIGAGVTYLERLELRFNPEHPPLPKMLAAAPLVARRIRADYSSLSWTESRDILSSFMGQWVFGQSLLAYWNDPASTLAWARAVMLLLTLLLGWVLYRYGTLLGGPWGGLLCLSVFVATPLFLAMGPLVHTDIAVTLFSVLTLWRFADLWREPSRRNIAWFALALAGALLSKFTAGLLFLCVAAFALTARWRPPGPRVARWRAIFLGFAGAAAAVYAVYFVFSWNQSTDALDRLGTTATLEPLRRALMPPWLYLRGVLMMLFMAIRPAYLLGDLYPHGVWFYFPVLLALKSPLGFLGLLALAATAGIASKRTGLIPDAVRPHWRILWVSLVVLAGACILSRVNIGFRHFSVPLSLMILLLAPLPALVGRSRVLQFLTAALAAACLVTAVRAFPFYVPYVSPLGLDRPPYWLVGDSNLDWNQALPEVRRFAAERGLSTVLLDHYGINDVTPELPQAQLWNCQKPAAADAGRWAVVSANMIAAARNCVWLTTCPRQELAGGSMFAFRLPLNIPEAGRPGGPPLPAEQRGFMGGPPDRDPRGDIVELYRHPDRMPAAIAKARAELDNEMKKRARR
jgi:4-amino-4-deoxy-L-arabinose transferase-like glycosyltransferase